jgi:zinc-ribbon domain
MSGLLRRIRRPGAAEETRTEATTPAPAHGSAPEAPATSEDGQRLPAGIAPEDLERRGATGRRSRLRRRARFLRRARELALRDLGGLVYEARRREQDGGKLVEDKVARLAALDSELSGIEATLGMPRGETVIREPGVGGTCARCGELHSSDARFCSHCGANLEEAAAQAAEKARADKAARAEAEKAEAEKTEAASKESSDGAGNGRTAVTATDAPTTEQPATQAADAPAAQADQPTTEQAPADEPATKPLA